MPRRPGEGRRQLFDRDEIREADGRQDGGEVFNPFFYVLPFFTKLMYPDGGGAKGESHPGAASGV